jgi:hypothetical protein
MVRAKFRLVRYETQTGTKQTINADGKQVYTPAEVRTLVFMPVYSDKPGTENKLFWDATPTGEIKLGVVNQDAWQHFELDKQYYVDFTPA